MAGEVVLGPVVFRGFEVPEAIRFGGRQRLAVHVLPGGGRVVDAMGADEEPLRWSGVFSGADAASRVRVLERLRRDGSVVGLSWGGWRYTVILERFEAESVNPAWIPYQVQVCVVAVGDVVAAEGMPAVATAGEVAALEAGAGVVVASGLDAAIDASSVLLGSADVGVAIGASGTQAQLVAARAFSGFSNGNIT